MTDRFESDGDEYFYRGFNYQINLAEALRPRDQSQPLEQGVECGDDSIEFGDFDFAFGLCASNTVHLHERGKSPELSPGISTTPFFLTAKKYALHNNKYQYGFVAKISKLKLLASGVKIFQVNNVVTAPLSPTDDEHWLYFYGDFPIEAIVDTTVVFR